jgi:ABC-type transport system involved in multi-copper enzyme maturation permease subunit
MSTSGMAVSSQNNDLKGWLNSMWGVARLTLRLMLFSPRVMVFAAIGMFPVLIAILWNISRYFGVVSIHTLPFSMFMTLMGGFHFYFYIILLSLIYGTALFGDEIEENTISYLLLRPVKREAMWTGKMLAYLMLSVPVIVLSVFLTFFTLMWAAKYGNFANQVRQCIEVCLISVIGLIAYGSFFLWMGVQFKRSTMKGLVFAYIWEGFIPFAPGYVKFYCIRYYLLSMFPDQSAIPFNGMGIMNFYEQTATIRSVVTLLIITVIFGLMAIYKLKTSEFSSQE